jgi:hypothetical protein
MLNLILNEDLPDVIEKLLKLFTIFWKHIQTSHLLNADVVTEKYNAYISRTIFDGETGLETWKRIK